MPNLKHNYDRDEIGGRSSYPNMVKGGPGSAQSLAIEPVYVGDEFVEMWIAIDGDGPSLKLAPQQCHELGGELVHLARVLGFRKQEAATTEWACRWLEGELTPAPDEEWARKHAKTWHTTPVRRACGPWEVQS